MSVAQSNVMTHKRIHREIADAKKEDMGEITLHPSDDNLFLWKGTIPGPKGSCYEGGVFNVDVQLADDYPFSAPKVLFTTRIYHMNISNRGNVCIDILKQNWSPALSLYKVILSLSSLLTDPNPRDPLVPSIANQFVRNRKLHDQTARRWTELYARPQPPVPPLVPPVDKGKAEETVTTPNLAQTPVGSSSSAESDTIVIEDSDDDSHPGFTQPPRTHRKQKRKSEVIEIEEDQASVSKRRAISTEQSKSERRGRTWTQGNRQPTEENIIIIDD